MKNQISKKVVIIGGGVAGLSAGVYARLAGFEAEIYEKNTIPGGECIGWNRKGYHIDNCIHWLTGTKKGTELYDVWKTVGALSDETEYAKVDSFYTSEYKGEVATLWNDLERTEKELKALSPEDAEEIEKFIQYVEYSKQRLMCDYLPKSYCTYSFLVSYATMADGNGNIPLGASLQMSLRMEKRFKELGGKIF